MTARFFKVERAQHVYLTFIAEAHDGLCTISTVDNAKGIVRIIAPEGQEQEVAGLIQALQNEIGMVEVAWPDC